MQNRIANLLTVKSIVTVVLTTVFSVLALRGSISGTEFLTIFTTIIAFYFGTQTEKRKNEEIS
jgi:5-bromo-4-chloroindolyl phosphate hydrolysis protein